MFDFSPVGASVAVIGVIFIVFIGFRLLPKHRKSPKSMADIFNIEDYIFEIGLFDKSLLIGKNTYRFKRNSRPRIYRAGHDSKRRKTLVNTPRLTFSGR